jgi:phosphatidylserine decarboxylase
MLEWATMRERLAALALRWSPKGAFSHGVGWLSRRPVPRPLRRPLYAGFARLAGADLSVLDRPLEDFRRFDDFFTRPLVAGARPVTRGDDVIVSPVDGRVSQVGVAVGGRLIQVKGLDYTVRGLLADPVEARQFSAGAYVTIYLAPRDYHRIHAPVSGDIVGYHHIPGAFYPVNPLSVRNVPGLFSINERLVTYLETPLGRVAVVKVAAVGVGHISLSYEEGVHTHRRGRHGGRGRAERLATPRPVQAGEELGIFHLGSTVIVLFEPGRVSLDVGPDDTLRMGEPLGRRRDKARHRAPPGSPEGWEDEIS